MLESERPQKQYNTAHALCMLDKQGHTHTHREYAILIAFPWQRWLHGRPSMLRDTYITCLVSFNRVSFNRVNSKAVRVFILCCVCKNEYNFRFDITGQKYFLMHHYQSKDKLLQNLYRTSFFDESVIIPTLIRSIFPVILTIEMQWIPDQRGYGNCSLLCLK